MIARRKAAGDDGVEARHILKRRRSDVVYRAVITDTRAATEPTTA
jgi:transposase